MVERTVPAGVRREVDRPESAEVYLPFLTITHPEISDAIRVVANPVDIILGGETFTGFRFSITVVTDTDRAPEARFKIQNVDLIIGNALRGLDSPATIKMELIAGSEFDQTVDPHTEIATAARIRTANQLRLVDVDGDALFITGKLQTRDYSREVWPGNAIQEAFPGLFR